MSNSHSYNENKFVKDVTQSVIKMTKTLYQIEIDESSFYFKRYVAHLKELGKRIYRDKLMPNIDQPFRDMVKSSFPEEYVNAVKIGEDIEKKYSIILTEEEIIYITAHLLKFI